LGEGRGAAVIRRHTQRGREERVLEGWDDRERDDRERGVRERGVREWGVEEG